MADAQHKHKNFPGSKRLAALQPYQKLQHYFHSHPCKLKSKSNSSGIRKLANSLPFLLFSSLANPTMSNNDVVDKLVIFLAKRDGIDKLVKTFQYVSKLTVWHMEATNPDAARRAKLWEVASGLSRKAFRTGRFLTGFNALRRSPGSTPVLRFLAVFANAGEMVYFFFDHFLWLSRIGVLEESLARRMSFISAFGEALGYVFFIMLDFIAIREGLAEQRRARESDKERVRKIRGDRVMRLMAMAANVADLVIALADIEPNPVCNHAVTLGISGLVSAWAGWYRNWPS